jgi:hypothetical protein
MGTPCVQKAEPMHINIKIKYLIERINRHFANAFHAIPAPCGHRRPASRGQAEIVIYKTAGISLYQLLKKNS